MCSTPDAPTPPPPAAAAPVPPPQLGDDPRSQEAKRRQRASSGYAGTFVQPMQDMSLLGGKTQPNVNNGSLLGG